MKCSPLTLLPSSVRFLAENKSKKQAAEKESSREKEALSADREQEKSSKSAEIFSVSSTAYADSKDDKTLPFFDPGEEEFLKSQGLKERVVPDDAEVQRTPTARDIFGKWGDEPSFSASYSSKEKGRREANEPSDAMEDEMYQVRKLSKKEEKSKKKEKKEKEKQRRSPSPGKERPLFPGAFPSSDPSPVRPLSASREDFELKFSALEELPRYELIIQIRIPQNPGRGTGHFVLGDRVQWYQASNNAKKYRQ